MRQLTIFLAVSLGVLGGCGGAVSKTDDVGGSDSNGGAPAAGAGTGGSTAGGSATSEPLGDPTNPNYPAPPHGSAAFFWRYGLGNWFIAKSDDANRDATFDEDGGIVTWKAEGAAMQSLDLWAQLIHPAGRPVDLSLYSGISFDAELTGANAQFALMFNAFGKYEEAMKALEPQRFSITSDWQTFQLRFGDIGYAANATTSVDFIVTNANAPFILRVRNLALLCKTSCP